MKHELYEEFRCRECDQVVCWAESKRTGKTYLAVPTQWTSDAEQSGNQRNNSKTFYPGHDCQPTPEVQAELAAAKERAESDKNTAIRQGRFVVGQTIEIYKGKKFPVGTRGVVFWIATEKKYDSYSCGIETTDGQRIFVDVKNVMVVATGRAVCSVCIGTGRYVSTQSGTWTNCLHCETQGTVEVEK